MGDCSPLLYFDRQEHTWRFYVKDSGELVYSIMYEEDKWTKESKIDSEVLDFTANIDRELKVYIIYSIKGGILKYCIWENNQWFGKTLYAFENQGYQIRELNVNTIGKYMHIFFTAKNNSKKKQCSLMHFCFNNEENIFNTIYNISFMQESYSHFQVEVLKDSSLYLLLIHKQENEIAIKFTKYKDGKWSIPRRLYGINGSNINFCTLQHNNKISILNSSKENSIYSLEHVLIEVDGKMKSNKIHESSIELKNYLLLEISGGLWAMWSEGEKVFASSHKGKWSEPVLYGDEINEVILTYKYLSLNNKYKDLKSKYVIATMPPEIRVLLPEDKSNEDKSYSLENTKCVLENTKCVLENSDKDIVNPIENDEEKNENIDDELMVLKRSNKNLEKRIIDLQFQLQQKQRIMGESDENFIKLTNAKKKAEEKLNLIAEVQQASIRELEEIKKQKTDRENVESELKIKLDKLADEKEELKRELEEIKKQKSDRENIEGGLKIKLDKLADEKEELKRELEEIKKQKIEIGNVVSGLKNKCKELTSENEQIKIELKYENNKGFMDRILKKKLDR